MVGGWGLGSVADVHLGVLRGLPTWDRAASSALELGCGQGALKAERDCILCVVWGMGRELGRALQAE